jgi:hypothetical protein
MTAAQGDRAAYIERVGGAEEAGWRKRQGPTQARLALAMSVTSEWASQIERGELGHHRRRRPLHRSIRVPSSDLRRDDYLEPPLCSASWHVSSPSPIIPSACTTTVTGITTKSMPSLSQHGRSSRSSDTQTGNFPEPDTAPTRRLAGRSARLPAARRGVPDSPSQEAAVTAQPIAPVIPSLRLQSARGPGRFGYGAAGAAGRHARGSGGCG